MSDYVAEVARATGLARQLPTSKFYSNKNIAVGLRDGYLVLFDSNPIVRGERKAVRILVRAGKIRDLSAVSAAVQKHFGFGRHSEVDSHSVKFDWSYTFRRPTPTKLRAVLEEVLNTLRSAATPIAACENCSSASSLDISVLGPEPKLLCSKCRQRLLDDLAAFEARYKALPLHLGRAIIVAGLSCAGGAEFIARFFHSSGTASFFWATGALGVVLGVATRMAAGKTTPAVKTVAYASSIGAVWIAILRSVQINDGTLRALGGGPLLIGVLEGLWFTWLPCLATYLTLGLCDALLTTHRERKVHASLSPR